MFGGLDRTSFIIWDCKFLVCAKINLKFNGKNIRGFVIIEEDDAMKVSVEDEVEMITVKCPEYHVSRGWWNIDNIPLASVPSNVYILSELSPI